MLTTLVALMLLASLGAMAAPQYYSLPLPAVPALPQNIADSSLDNAASSFDNAVSSFDNAASSFATAGAATVLSNVRAQAIKGAGGIATREEEHHPHPHSHSHLSLTPPPPAPVAPARPQSIADSGLENAGGTIGTAFGGVVPSYVNAEAIKGAGGIATREEEHHPHPHSHSHLPLPPPPSAPAPPARPQSIADSGLENTVGIIGTAFDGVVPSYVNAEAIKGAGGIATREEEHHPHPHAHAHSYIPPPPPAPAPPARPQNIADNLFGHGGNVIGTAGAAIVPSNVKAQGIHADGGAVA